ncbi:MAG TPA: hypothetical protein VIV56_16840 [Gemmatimonadales bacterium]
MSLGAFDCANASCARYHELVERRYGDRHRPKCERCGRTLRLLRTKQVMDETTKNKLRAMRTRAADASWDATAGSTPSNEEHDMARSKKAAPKSTKSQKSTSPRKAAGPQLSQTQIRDHVVKALVAAGGAKLDYKQLSAAIEAATGVHIMPYKVWVVAKASSAAGVQVQAPGAGNENTLFWIGGAQPVAPAAKSQKSKKGEKAPRARAAKPVDTQAQATA